MEGFDLIQWVTPAGGTVTEPASIVAPALEFLRDGDAQSAYLHLEPLVAIGIASATPLLASASAELGLPAVTDQTVPTAGGPPVTWSEVPEHLIRRLFMDPEWIVQEEARLTWWPWFLAQSFSLTSAGYFGEGDDRDPWLTVTANIDIAQVPEDVGLQLASEVNNTFPLGAVVYDEPVLAMRSTLTLSSLNRNMLRLFHEAALAQATVAHEVALFLQDRGFEVCESAHPSTGLRAEADEMLNFFAGSERAVPPAPDLIEKIHRARPRYLEELLSLGGLSEGWSNDEVDFVTVRESPLLDVAIAQPADNPDNARYGSGIRLYVRILPPGSQFPLAALNYVNLDLLNWSPMTMLGNVRSDELSQEWGSYYCTYLPSGPLEEASNIEEWALAVEVVNTVLHSLGPGRVAQDVLLQGPES